MRDRGRIKAPSSDPIDVLRSHLREQTRQIADLYRRLPQPPTTAASAAGGGAAFTVRVAASDASDTSKATADYVCDGTNDESEIRSALTACSTLGGGRVLLSEGTFTISVAGVADIPANTLLQGLHKNATRLEHVGGSANSVLIGSTIAGEGSAIADMTLDALGITDGGYGLVLDGDRSRVERVRMVGLGMNTAANIDFSGSHAIVRDCDFINPAVTGCRGVYFRSDHNRISGCYFNNVPAQAIACAAGADFSIVTGNDVEWSQTDNGATDAFSVGANSVVVGNICQDNRGSPATVASGAGSQVANNVLL